MAISEPVQPKIAFICGMVAPASANRIAASFRNPCADPGTPAARQAFAQKVAEAFLLQRLTIGTNNKMQITTWPRLQDLIQLQRPEQARPIRSETRVRLVAAIARGRRWRDELIADSTASVDSIAKRENCSARKINMTISLAFLAPDLVQAAIDGRLPHGMGVARLSDLPAEWSRQYQMLGLPAR